MNYELAKRLKDNGFPQKESRDRSGGGSFHREQDGSWTMIPNLEELIESLGRKFWAIERVGKWFVARAFASRSFIHKNEILGISVQGKTSSEAVANLWLELNNDKKGT